MNALTRWVVPAVFVVLVAGCASTPAPVLLTLPPAVAPPSAAPAPAPGSGASPPVLAVRRINIPEYLVARRVRYRTDASTLAEWPNTFWAERIEIGVAREFVSALRDELPGWSLCETSCGDSAPDLALQVDLEPLDYLRGAQQLRARARLTLSGAGASPKVLRTQELSYELNASADTAQAQAQVMATLIRQVAAAAAPLVRSAKP